MKQKRIFIAVASKTGTTMRCATRLAGLLSDHSVEVCDLTREQPSPAGYDLVIVGGSIRLGRLHPAARRYMRSNQALLQNMQAAYYICNCFVEQKEALFQSNVPAGLLEKAVCTDSFGGELDLDRQKGLDKLVAKMAVKSLDGHAVREICTHSIEAFATAIQKAESPCLPEAQVG